VTDAPRESFSELPCRAFSPDGTRARRHPVAVESPLEIVVNGRPCAVLMRTPGEDVALAAGWCLSEGIIESKADLASIAYCGEADSSAVKVTLTAERLAAMGGEIDRSRFISVSSCGLCGKRSLDELIPALKPVESAATVGAEALAAMPETLRSAQKLFALTGATHAAGLFSAEGRLLASAEDIGRHNALDKASGGMLLTERLGEAACAVVTGRASLEMVLKAARANLPVLAAVSATTTAAVELADRLGMTLVAFLRGRSMNVYTRPDRIR